MLNKIPGSRRVRKRKGAATVEMALVAPFVFLLVFGSIEFARMMMVKQAFTNAIRRGCRDATLPTILTSAHPESVVREALQGVIQDSTETEDLRVSFSPEPGTAGTGEDISGSVEIDCADASWLPAFFTAGTKIRCTCRMKRE